MLILMENVLFSSSLRFGLIANFSIIVVCLISKHLSCIIIFASLTMRFFILIFHRKQKIHHIYIYYKKSLYDDSFNYGYFSILWSIFEDLPTVKQMVDSNQTIWPVILFYNINHASFSSIICMMDEHMMYHYHKDWWDVIVPNQFIAS